MDLEDDIGMLLGDSSKTSRKGAKLDKSKKDQHDDFSFYSNFAKLDDDFSNSNSKEELDEQSAHESDWDDDDDDLFKDLVETASSKGGQNVQTKQPKTTSIATRFKNRPGFSLNDNDSSIIHDRVPDSKPTSIATRFKNRPGFGVDDNSKTTKKSRKVDKPHDIDEWDQWQQKPTSKSKTPLQQSQKQETEATKVLHDDHDDDEVEEGDDLLSFLSKSKPNRVKAQTDVNATSEFRPRSRQGLSSTVQNAGSHPEKLKRSATFDDSLLSTQRSQPNDDTFLDPGSKTPLRRGEMQHPKTIDNDSHDHDMTSGKAETSNIDQRGVQSIQMQEENSNILPKVDGQDHRSLPKQHEITHRVSSFGASSNMPWDRADHGLNETSTTTKTSSLSTNFEIQQLNAQISDLQSQNSQLKEKILSLENQKAEEHQVYEKKISELQLQHSEALKTKDEETQTRLESLRADKDDEINRIRTCLLEEMALLRQSHQQSLQTIESSHKKEIEYQQKLRQEESLAAFETKSNADALKSLMTTLQSSAMEVSQLKKTISSDSDGLSQAKLAAIQQREAWIESQEAEWRNRLKSLDKERHDLQQTYARFEESVRQQRIEQEQREWQLQQRASRIEAQEVALSEERNRFAELTEKERLDIADLRAELMRERTTYMSDIQTQRQELAREAAALRASIQKRDTEERQRVQQIMEAEASLQESLLDVQTRSSELDEKARSLRKFQTKLSQVKRKIEEERQEIETAKEEVQQLSIQTQQQAEELAVAQRHFLFSQRELKQQQESIDGMSLEIMDEKKRLDTLSQQLQARELNLVTQENVTSRSQNQCENCQNSMQLLMKIQRDLVPQHKIQPRVSPSVLQNHITTEEHSFPRSVLNTPKMEQSDFEMKSSHVSDVKQSFETYNRDHLMQEVSQTLKDWDSEDNHQNYQ